MASITLKKQKVYESTFRCTLNPKVTDWSHPKHLQLGNHLAHFYKYVACTFYFSFSKVPSCLFNLTAKADHW